MKHIFFTVGPAQIHPIYASIMQQALQAQIGSISHRSKTFMAIYEDADMHLRTLMNIPNTHAILFAGSASELWERILLNTVQQHSFHFINGEFSQKFFNYAKALNKQSEHLTIENGNGFLGNLEVPDNTELICTTQNETSTGVRWQTEQLKVLKEKYPNKLLCTDIVSSAPLQEVDFNFMDMAFFSVQKAFGMPAGLGVWIVNKNILEKAKAIKKSGISIGAHQTLEAYLKNYENWQTPSTPNVMAIYCLGKIAEWYNANNFAALKKELFVRMDNLYEALSNSNVFTPLVVDKNSRSRTIAVFNTSKPAAQIIEAAKHTGLILGSGYGSLKEYQIRVGNFPAISNEEWLQMQNFLIAQR